MLPLTHLLRLMSHRFLRLLLVVRFRVSAVVRSIAPISPTFFTSLCKSILSIGRCRGPKSQIPHIASDVPTRTADIVNPQGECSQTLDRAKVELEEVTRGTLATLPVLGTVWQDELPRFQALLPSSHKFDPATPEGGSKRYKRRTVKQVIRHLDIPAGQQGLLSALPQLPDGWRRHVHPEGNVFFYHEGLRIFTENDISETAKEEEVLSCAGTLIQNAIRSGDVSLDKLCELVLNVDDSQHCYYYFVDHTRRLLFWVVSVNSEDLGTDLQGTNESSHIRYFLEVQYWYASFHSLLGMSPSICIVFYDLLQVERIMSNMQVRSHCEYYPHNRTLPKGVFGDLRGMLNYFKTDMMTADSSSSPFAQDELVAILDLINSLKDDQRISDPYSIWVIARLMVLFTENQFLKFHGQPCARLNADISLFGQQTWHHHPAFKVINLFLFGSPNEHSVRLQRVWVDGTIIQPRWKDFASRLTTELGRYTLFSTVMLAVNFSFLAVPGVTNPDKAASAIEIIIYCSVASTTASIIFSFALLNVYNDPRLMAAGVAAKVMETISQSNTGMACLSITHSLPIACLVWSITLFSAALAVQIFGTKERAIVATLGVECFILVLLAGMSMRVLRWFSRNDVDDDEKDTPEKASEEKDVSQHDVERGSGR